MAHMLAGIPFGTKGYTPGRNYQLIHCDKCGRTMWIGPTQAEKRRAEKLDAWCSGCIREAHPDGSADLRTLRTDDSGSRYRP